MSKNTRPTFNQVFDLACMLPLNEQQMLLDRVQLNIEESTHHFKDIPEELKARLRESYQQAVAGEAYTQEESDVMMDDIVEHCKRRHYLCSRFLGCETR